MTGRPGEDAAPRLPEAAATPWVETPAGSLFFLNAVLVAPVAVALVPLTVGWALRATGLLDGPSPLLDPIPVVFGYMARGLGWLAVVPLVLTVRNLAIVDRNGPRVALVVFLLAHAGVLVWTAWRWLG